MPGRLLMDHQGAIGLTVLKKDRSQAQQPNLPRKPDFVQEPAPAVGEDNASQHVATNGSLPNSALAHNSPLPTINGQSADNIVSLPTPPALDQSWRESDANKSMGTLIDRLAHQCFEDLSNVIEHMTESSTDLQTGHSSGVAARDDNAVARKLSFMGFAQNQRDRFIKTLVLSDWARHAGDDMARLVDIKVWQEKQNDALRQVIDSIGITKHSLERTKVQEPNIDGALQLLATGKASSKVPHLGYIPPKRLTAKQLLRTLQDMNVTLATRLNLHIELPPHFNDFSIANGRATFRVIGEFEVDLSVAEEDPSTPFYFIDIRFLFSPAPSTVDERFRAVLEGRINAALATEGLQGCYSFLHGFVLTHKINILADQTRRIHDGKWFDCVKITWKNRVLILQYWTGQRGKMSWLEFGVSTGKKHSTSSRRPPTSRLTVRWFRRGELVENETIDIDWQRLDVEKILSRVIAKHASWSLSQLKDRLLTLAGPNTKLEIGVRTSSAVPEECSLMASLPGLHPPLCVRLEPVTGRLSLSPSTPRAAHSERALNSDTSDNIGSHLATFLCKTIQDRSNKAAEIAGWMPLSSPSIPNEASFRSLFGKDIRSWKVYVCNKGWGDSWVVVVTVSLSSEKWHIARLQRSPNQPATPNAKVFTFAQRIPVGTWLTAASNISRTSMLQIERLAVAEVSFAVLSQQLQSMNIPHRLEKQASLTFDEGNDSTPPAASAVFFRGSALLKDSFGKDFVIDSIRVTHQGILENSDDGEVAESRHEIRLSVETSGLSNLRKYLTKNPRNSDVTMNASGALALRLRTPFGLPYFQQLLDRLQACDRLDRYLTNMQHFKFECTAATLHKVSFKYGPLSQLAASVVFPKGDGNFPVALKLEPMGSNPHRRTRVMLERLLNSSMRNSFGIMCRSMYNTTPLLRAFERMELAHQTKRTISIHPRNPALFTVAYMPPLANLTFKLELCERRQNTKTVVAWKIKSDKTRQELEASDVGKAVLELAKDKAKNWRGLEDGAFSAFSADGVAEVLDKLDEVIQKFETGESIISKQESTVSGDAKPANAPQQHQQPPQLKPTKLTQQRPPPQKAPQQKMNVPPAANGPRTMTVNANASRNPNTAAARNNQGKVKQEIIELD